MSKFFSLQGIFSSLFGVTAAIFVSACGGGGGGDSPAPAATAPSITTQPASVSTAAGQPANFSVVASGSGTLTYQWRRNGTAISGANSASYGIAATTLGDNGAQFTVVVSNSVGSVASNAAVLSVTAGVAPAQITTQPQAASVSAGQTATFTVVATGTAPLAYQWRRNGTNIAGAAASSYTTAATTVADNGAIFDVQVSNAAGSVTSAAALLTVTAAAVAPAITTQPANQTVSAGQSAVFSVVASGTAPLSYQWRRNGLNIAGATLNSYTTPATTSADSGASFSVVVTNSAGSATSNPASLTVVSAAVAPTITTQPQAATAQAGQTATFTVAATGTAPLAYQWLRNGVAITGAVNASHTTPALTTADNGVRYSVRVSNSAGTITSSEAVLTVTQPSSGLVGRAWTTGQLLETGDISVIAYQAGIDDSGRVVAAFVRSDGTRNVIYATRGQPNAAGVAPTWSAPQIIDVTATGQAVPVSSSGGSSWSLGVSPNGNAVLLWSSFARCTATTYSPFTGNNCRYLYYARYLASTNVWEPAVLIGDSPDSGRIGEQAFITDAGDVVFAYPGWIRSGSSSYTVQFAIARRANGASSLSTQLLSGEAGSTFGVDWYRFAVDNSGNILYARELVAAGTTDIVVYSGTLAAGLASAPVTLDTRNAAASLGTAAIGNNGRAIVVWEQNNGVENTVYIANRSSSSEPWQAIENGRDQPFSSAYVARFTSEGASKIYVLSSIGLRGLYDRPAGTTGWTFINSGDGFGSDYFDIARNGDVLAVDRFGSWASFDARTNSFVQRFTTATTGPGRILGVQTSSRAFGGTPLLAPNGVGAYLSVANFDVLPTPSQPAGDGRRTVDNLWGLFFK